MNPSKSGWIAAALLLLSACVGGLPPSLRRDIAYEHDSLRNAERQIDRAQQTVREDVAADADLFANTPVAAEWTSSLQAARMKLKSAEDSDRQLAEVSRRNRADSRETAERLITKERELRDSAVTDSQAVEAAAARWIGFKQDLPSNLEKMKREVDAVHAVDLAPLSTTLQQAEHDWPAKKTL